MLRPLGLPAPKTLSKYLTVQSCDKDRTLMKINSETCFVHWARCARFYICATYSNISAKYIHCKHITQQHSHLRSSQVYPWFNTTLQPSGMQMPDHLNNVKIKYPVLSNTFWITEVMKIATWYYRYYQNRSDRTRRDMILVIIFVKTDVIICIGCIIIWQFMFGRKHCIVQILYFWISGHQHSWSQWTG